LRDAKDVAERPLLDVAGVSRHVDSAFASVKGRTSFPSLILGNAQGLPGVSEKAFLAIDMGASGGRHVAGLFDGRRLRLDEIYRFENGAVPAADRLYWDMLNQWSHIRNGLRAAGAAHLGKLVSVGIDTWGVDFALVGRGDELLGNPYSYRDRRTEGMLAKAFAVVSREEIFASTGLQFMQINSLYQLLSMRLAKSPLLDAAEHLLMMPDLFHWLLTGVMANETTNATTTQFYNPQTRNWTYSLLEKLDLPTAILGQLTAPGTRLGKLRASVASDVGLADIDVVLPGTHDTASAVLAAPAVTALGDHPDWCYISSGTWSLMGVEVAEPIVTKECLELNFTNEGGVGGSTRVLKNIMGLWLVQECRRIWNLAGANFRWQDLTHLAASAPPLVSLVNPDDPRFLAPGDMPAAIRQFCRDTGQPVPADEGAVIRTAIESLALRYRQTLECLEQLVGNRIQVIHVVGGGAQNLQLCQATADACRRRVIAGPIEATAIGNLLVQAMTAREVESIAEAREIVRQSFPVETYEPREATAWDEAYSRFLRLQSN
jgi:rhamnulokinase